MSTQDVPGGTYGLTQNPESPGGGVVPPPPVPNPVLTLANIGTTAGTVAAGNDARILAATTQAQNDARYPQAGHYVATLGPSNGTGDAATINAALTAVGNAGRGLVKGQPGQSYVIDATVVIPSNVTLDISSCALVRLAGYTGFMLSNTAAYPQRTTTDAAMTSGSNVLTSATANFINAAYPAGDVGRPVTVVGAGLGIAYGTTPYDLYATISSVTNSTTAVLSVNAQQAAGPTTLYVYGRDRNVGVVGNASTLIEAGTCAGSLYFVHFRRIDGLTIRGGGGQCGSYNGAGVAFWSTGDVTDLEWDDWVFTITAGQTAPGAGCIQPCGPMDRFSITNVRGQPGDDMVALQGSARGFVLSAAYNTNDVQGDITNGVISGVYPGGGLATAVKLFGGITNANVNTKLAGITIEKVYGSTALDGVMLESDRGGYATLDDINVRDIHMSVGAGYAPVDLALTGVVSTLSGKITVEGVGWDGTSGTSGARRQLVTIVGNTSQVTVKSCAVVQGNYVDIVSVRGSIGVETLTVDDTYVGPATSNTNNVAIYTPATVTNLQVTKSANKGTGVPLLNTGTVTAYRSTVVPVMPSAIPGLVAWYKADTLGLANGAAVASWADSSSSGIALAQATGADQPIFTTGLQNGLPGVVFNGTSDVLAAATGVTVGHVFVVAKYSAATFAVYAGLITGTSAITGDLILTGTTGQNYWQTSGATAQYLDGNTQPYGVFVPAPMNAAGIAEAASSSAFTNPMTLMVGQDRGLSGRFWNGPIFEIVVFSAVLPAAARQAVEAYLQAKWATPLVVFP